jgi:hypothetical protein
MTKREGYLKYLATERWKSISDKVKKRDGYRCRLCNGTENLNAHHRTYEHKGDEENHLGDLTTLCGDCHTAYHEWRKNGGRIAKKQAMVTLTHSRVESLRKKARKDKRIARAFGIGHENGFRWMDLEGEMMPAEQWERLMGISPLQ